MEKTIYINSTEEINGVLNGLAVWNTTIDRNFLILFPPAKASAIHKQLMEAGEGYFIVRFCQYIVYTQLNNLGWAMRIIDYSNDLDSALDEYNELLEKGWNAEDRNRIMTLFQEIKAHPNEVAKMVLIDPVK